MIQELIHAQIVKNCSAVSGWFQSRASDLKFPFYSSFDIRDSGYKVAPVDANLFPAGFNNICPTDKDNAPPIVKEYLDKHYGMVSGRKVLLLAEEHTQNAYYWENVASIADLLQAAGCRVVISWPRELNDPFTAKSASGRTLNVHPSIHREGQVYVAGEKMDLIICNNDFSVNYEAWGSNVQTPMNPPKELGWYQRRKSHFFNQYNLLAGEFARLIGVPEHTMVVATELFENFDVDSEESRDRLAVKVDEFLYKLNETYRAQNISGAPFCFIKNNSGTYGLAVVKVHSGQEIREWNYKTRKKMKAAKGGSEVVEVILQEGIPTRFREEGGGVAEPCIYMIGDHLVGGFLRTHAEKGIDESLNSPGAVYKKLCMSDLEVDLTGCPMENVYGWTSKLSALAIALEAKAAGVEFRGYR